MGPPSVSKANVKFPVFVATFAHNNPSILVVGGGGGAGRSGVPNAICAFDTSSRAPTLEPFARADLSRDEDSVTSLASVSTKEGCIVYAGINSSEEERLKGQNSHFRAYELVYPRRKPGKVDEEQEGKIEYLSKARLLTPSSENARREGYQRLVRLSPPASKSGGKRIGVVASSLQGEENELLIFAAVSTKPATSDIIQRVSLRDREANDVDITVAEDGQFQIAYCLDSAVYVQRFAYDFDKKNAEKKLEPPAKRYEAPLPDVLGKKARPKLRALRWLSPSHLLLLVNQPNRTGVELRVLRLYSEDGMGSIIMRKSLGKGAKQAVDMDVVKLDSNKNGAFQSVIAVATQDVSLHIYTIDYDGSSLHGLARYAVYHDVHDVQMTKVVWSPFSPAEAAQTKNGKPRLIRLASTSLSGSISVDTFELRHSNERNVLLSSMNRRLYNTAIYAACAFIALMLALMVQSLFDPEGNLTKGIIPASLQNAASGAKAPGVLMEDARRAQTHLDHATAPVAKTSQRIRDMLSRDQKDKEEQAQKRALIIHHDPEADSSLSTEVHEGEEEDIVKKHTKAKRWQELSQAERQRWKEKLVKAGMWAVEEGETILKGIFFSEAAGFVGNVAQGVING
ncbi:uncharacterized protein EI97DRAFT_464179 [Westerdykella ornata]|uniref:Guanine nucleotide-exchange factor SEC12 n=1 Tax=Westerdykella ornata TaxID=318751 RepID=A0A6A6JWP9_WESOR|nr:uncharacterized protein EI97DRAFT_464179 [Westerdykella ornata]KAF2280166.1 hypothetical protein EI97DRAFT_464179 [Westerdykella ornata]